MSTYSEDLDARYARKPPMPIFGGKSKAAPLVWRLLGDPAHYVEAFCGGMAVLLNRPHLCNRAYFSETVNDLDGLLVNAWRSIKWHSDETAEAASWPVSEADKIARQLACLRWLKDKDLEHLMGDEKWCDPLVAGYWLYGVCCQIGAFIDDGPWTADPATGRIYKQPPVKKGREPGVNRNRPGIHDQGRGVNHPGLREPGVRRSLPSITKGGQGVTHPGLREPGVSRKLPNLHDGGKGVNAPQLREPGVQNLSDSQSEYHPLTMPKLRQWFALLSARLRHVRIVNGDWRRVCTHGALYTLSVGKQGPAALFLDPPYDSGERAGGLYRGDADAGDVAAECRAWCLKHGGDKDLRIVLAGYDSEHGDLEAAGWTAHEWFSSGFLTGGMGNVGGNHQQDRERLWASPGCLSVEPAEERTLWNLDDDPLDADGE